MQMFWISYLIQSGQMEATRLITQKNYTLLIFKIMTVNDINPNFVTWIHTHTKPTFSTLFDVDELQSLHTELESYDNKSYQSLTKCNELLKVAITWPSTTAK